MVVSYGTSPAAEVIFAEEELSESPTASLVGRNMCFRQIEFAGILKGSKNRALAEKFIDFMLSTQFQEDIPLNMFVFPVNQNAHIPQEFLDHIQVPDHPAVVDTDEIAENREVWVEAWRELMLR
jgi:thiamine transport system substrate-binding protein